MSNCKWIELPDYQDEKLYDFVDDYKLNEIAWEGLRRWEGYRADWQAAQAIKEKFGKHWAAHDDAYFYDPPRLSNESANLWVRRVAGLSHSAKAIVPRVRMDDYFANKWGLASLANPYKPAEGNAKFNLSNEHVVTRIHFPHEIYDYAAEIEIDDGSGLDVINLRYLLTASDLDRPTAELVAEYEKKIRLQKAERKVRGEASKKVNRSNSPLTWKTYLRVLDARRQSPPATYEKIGKILAPLPDGVFSSNKQRGEKLGEAAKRWAQRGYRNVPFYSKGTLTV